MRYVVDIDGVLCHNDDPEGYSTAVPIKTSIDSINVLYNQGHEVILHTSRLQEDEQVTLDWLKSNNVNFDKLIMGKPSADAYIDDKAIQFIPHLGADVQRKKLCICFSGGMDSYIAYRYALLELGYEKEDIVCVYFNIGHNYADKELKALEDIRKEGVDVTVVPVGLCNAEFGNIPTRDKYIIPARNLIFASIGASLAERVWIVGIKFEDHYLMYDKNSNFFRLASMTTSQAVGSPTIIETPFSNWTKTDMLNWCKEKGIEKELKNTVSCYDDNVKRCGKCGLCFKRAIAMRSAGLNEHYDTEPFESEIGLDFISKYKEAMTNNDFSHYSKERIEETLDIVNRHQYNLENNLYTWID